MLYKAIFLFVLSLSLVSALLVGSDSASAQSQSYVADTGVFTLAPGQILRVSADGVSGEVVTVRFKKMDYVDAGSSGSILRKQLGSQFTTGPVTVSSDQSVSFDILASGCGVRGQLLSSSRNIKANAVIISPAGSNGNSSPPTEQISFIFTTITFEN